MKKLCALTAAFAAAYFLVSVAKAVAGIYNPPPLGINPTHITLPSPKPTSSSDAIKVAGVYWLPDYLKKNLDFNNRSQDGGEKPSIDKNCAALGYEIPSFVTDWNKYNYTEFLAANKTHCYKNFSCKTNYSETSCEQWYQLGGDSCKDEHGTFYERCDPKPCAAGYTAGISSCNPETGYTYVPNGYSGSSVCGKCTAKSCPSGTATYLADKAGYVKTATSSYSGSSICYQYSEAPCSGYGTKKEGSGWNCSDTCLSGTTTKYKCTAKTCTEGSLTPNCDSVNYNTVNTGYYSGDSICKKCTPKSCPTPKTCDYSCKTLDTSRKEMCGSICTECNLCIAGGSANCKGQTQKCTSDQVTTASCKDCTGTTLYSCRQKNDTCSSGSKTACNANQIIASVTTTEAGSKCYTCHTICASNICSSKNLTSTIKEPSCNSNSKSWALRAVGSCYCYNSRDVQANDALFSDLTTGFIDVDTQDELIPNKEIIGVLFNKKKYTPASSNGCYSDNDGFLAVSIKNSPSTFSWATEIITEIPSYMLAPQTACKHNTDNAQAISDYMVSKGSIFPAAQYATNFSTTGTSKGDWFLFNDMYEAASVLTYGCKDRSQTKAANYPYANQNCTSNTAKTYWSTDIHNVPSWDNPGNDKVIFGYKAYPGGGYYPYYSLSDGVSKQNYVLPVLDYCKIIKNKNSCTEDDLKDEYNKMDEAFKQYPKVAVCPDKGICKTLCNNDIYVSGCYNDDGSVSQGTNNGDYVYCASTNTCNKINLSSDAFYPYISACDYCSLAGYKSLETEAQVCEIENINGQTCYKKCKCKDGYLDAGNSGEDCYKCPEGWSIINGQCTQITCEEGFVYDEKGPQGSTCYSKTCGGLGSYSVSEHQCTCNSPYVPIDGLCGYCSEGKVYDSNGIDGPKCYGCENGGTYSLEKHKCLCKSGYIESNGQCCPNEYIYDANGPDGGKCYRCSGGNYSLSEHRCICDSSFKLSNCSTSKGAVIICEDKCKYTSCINGYTFNNGNCL